MSNIYMKKTVFQYLRGGILGAFIFISIYGIHIINGSYVDWILNASGDLTQSYYGWKF